MRIKDMLSEDTNFNRIIKNVLSRTANHMVNESKRNNAAFHQNIVIDCSISIRAGVFKAISMAFYDEIGKLNRDEENLGKGLNIFLGACIEHGIMTMIDELFHLQQEKKGSTDDPPV